MSQYTRGLSPDSLRDKVIVLTGMYSTQQLRTKHNGGQAVEMALERASWNMLARQELMSVLATLQWKQE